MKSLSGVCVPVCTVFEDDPDRIDESRYLAHVDRMLEAGVDIILPCGGTGEFAYLNAEEKRRLIEITVKHVNAGRGRCPDIRDLSQGHHLGDPACGRSRRRCGHGVAALLRGPR